MPMYEEHCDSLWKIGGYNIGFLGSAEEWRTWGDP